MLDMSVAKMIKKEVLLSLAAHMYVTSRLIYSWPADSTITVVTTTSSSGGGSGSGSDGVVYEYVDKSASYWVYSLRPQVWMSTAQQQLLLPYVAITGLVLIITLLEWVVPVSVVVKYMCKVLCFRAEVYGKAMHIPFSKVSYCIYASILK